MWPPNELFQGVDMSMYRCHHAYHIHRRIGFRGGCANVGAHESWAPSQVKYNPLAKDGPTIRVFDATGRSVVVDAETGMHVVTVIP
jgi:hypothetical protein